MQVTKDKRTIKIVASGDFDIKQILECGQIFSYEKFDDNHFIVVSANKFAEIFVQEGSVNISSDDIDYFYNFFDLSTDYQKIKKNLLTIYPDFQKFLCFGEGIRILRQDKLQTILSFIVSANNNIKRIRKILFALSKRCGKLLPCGMYSFPTLEELFPLSVDDYRSLGLGYRAEYMFESVRQLSTADFNLEKLDSMPTPTLKQKLLNLKGVGPKVADCILFFGFSRTDVFPVDTWVRKSYAMFSNEKRSDKQIADYFVNLFKNNSGYAQQYIFNYMISTNS